LLHEYGLVVFLSFSLILFDWLGHWHTEAGHPVQDVAADLRLGLLIAQSLGMKTPTDDGFVSVHGRCCMALAL
jgi:hypothetical protein